MYMWYMMFINISKEHPNENSIKHGNCWHFDFALFHVVRCAKKYHGTCYLAYFPLTPPEKSYSSSMMHYFSGFCFLERGNEGTADAGSLGQVIGIEDLPDGIRAVGGKLFVVQTGFIGCGDYRGRIDILDNLNQYRLQTGILV